MISTVVGIAVVVVLSLATLAGGAATLFVYLRRIIIESTTPKAGYEERLATLEMQIKEFPSLWEGERKRAKRLNDSAKAARKSAENKLEQVEEILEASSGLRGVDASAEQEPEMQPMLPGVGLPLAPNQRAAAVDRIAHLLR